MNCTIENGTKLCLRPVTDRDNLNHAAALIYSCDPYIYPYWDKTSKGFCEQIVPHMTRPGFIFNHKNLYAAFYTAPCGAQAIFSLVGFLDAAAIWDYDYGSLKSHNAHYDFVITNYIEKLIAQRRKLPQDATLMTCLSTDPFWRGLGASEALLRFAIGELSQRGYKKIYFDCLQDNAAALALYTKFAAGVCSHGIGFDGTDHSEVKTYNMVIDI